MTAPWPTAWHLGPAHPVEQLLTLVLAIAPFVVLGIVVVVRRRQHAPDVTDPSTRDLRSADEPKSRPGGDPGP